VGLTGIAKRPDMDSYAYEYLSRTATASAVSMAEELGLPYPKNVTFSKYDPIIDRLREAKYNVVNHPTDNDGVLVTFPVAYEDVPFDKVNGMEVNLESAIAQLERYKLLQTSWTQQNTSVTISYDPTEVNDIIDWLLANWDIYVGVSFLYRNDPTKTAKDLGYLYLPQEVVTKEAYDKYVSTLLPVNLENTESFEEITQDDCATGACPIK
jgi:hypothetical protein